MEETADDYFIKKGFKIEKTPNKIIYTQRIGGGKERIIKMDKYFIQGTFTEGDMIFPLCLDIWAIPSSYECEELRIAINTVLEELNNRIPIKDIEDKKRECENRRFSDFTNEPNFAVEKVLNELLNKE